MSSWCIFSGKIALKNSINKIKKRNHHFLSCFAWAFCLYILLKLRSNPNLLCLALMNHPYCGLLSHFQPISLHFSTQVLQLNQPLLICWLSRTPYSIPSQILCSYYFSDLQCPSSYSSAVFYQNPVRASVFFSPWSLHSFSPHPYLTQL